MIHSLRQEKLLHLAREPKPMQLKIEAASTDPLTNLTSSTTGVPMPRAQVSIPKAVLYYS